MERRAQPRRRPLVEEIEPRILYSADFAPAGLDALVLTPDSEQRTLDSSGEFNSDSALDVRVLRHELVFVDGRTPDLRDVVDGLKSSDEREIDVVVLDPDRDGVQQISEALAGRSDLDAVHILSHGEPGAVQLGSTTLNFDSLLANATKIKAWGDALSDQADLLIYGCDVVGSAEGRSLMEALARLTGADVAASEDPTGPQNLGGDWDLEFELGSVETRSAVDATVQSQFTSLLDLSTADATAVAPIVASTPLAFEVNAGQTDAQVDFIARGNGYAVWLTDGDAVIGLQDETGGYAVRLDLVGANADPAASGENLLETQSNYLVGSQDQWHLDVANYGAVRYDDVYSGVDLRYYGNQQQLEYDFLVKAGADAGAIRFDFEGAQDVAIDENGNLLLTLDSAGQTVAFKAPVAYQEGPDGRESVSSRYILLEDGSVGFEVGSYDASRELVIDPILSYGTYLGGSGGEQIWNMDLDAAGNVYVTGYTSSTNFAFPDTAGAFAGTNDIFVSKFSPDLGTLLYSTYIGGSGDDQGYGIVVDTSGNAYVSGYTTSTDFALVSPYDSTLSGGLDAFLLKLNASGSGLIYSTLLGGAGGEIGYGVAVDSAGSAYVSGYTDNATGFPLVGAFDTSLGGSAEAFVTKFSPTGDSLVYSTFLGGNGFDAVYNIEVTAAGNAVVVGESTSSTFTTALPGAYQAANGSTGNRSDAFVAMLNAAGTGLVYGTFLGGSNDDFGYAVALDAGGKIYIGGDTSSTNFDVTATAMQGTKGTGADGFIAVIDPALSGAASLVYSTYAGGNSTESLWGIDVDAAGRIYAASYTTSTNLAVTGNAYQAANGGGEDIFVLVLDPTVSGAAGRVYATYLGGSGADNAWAASYANGKFYVAGNTATASGITPSGYDTGFNGGFDGYVAAFSIETPPVVATSAGVLAYAESAGPIPIDSGLTVIDEDSASLASATVRITGNYLSTEDLLGFNDVNPWGIMGTWASATGTLTLTGVSSVANYQAALCSVTYQNTSEKPSTLTRTVTFTANDGGLTSAGAVRQITVSSLNDPAVNSVPGTQPGTEDSAVVFSAGNGNQISIADVDAGTAPIQVTLTATNGRLTLAQTGGLAFVSGDGSADAAMTFTGTIASINSALDGLRFDPNANYNGPASVQIATNDLGNSGSGGAQITNSTVNIDFGPVNDAPVQTVPGAQSTAQNTPLTFSSGTGNAITVADIDAGSGELRVTLTGTNGTLTLGATAGLSSVLGNGTGVVTLIGTLPNLNGALDSLTFTPSFNYSGAAGLTVATDDQGNTGSGGVLGDSDAIAITVSPNIAPTITLAVPPLAYAEGAPAIPVDAGLALSDPDNPILDHAQVRIASGYVQGEDELSFVNQLGITGSWNASTGTLLLTGAASPADYRAALRTVAFRNSSDDPSGTRTVTFVVNDGIADSAAATRDVTLVPQNDTPVITVPGSQIAREDTPLLFSPGTGNQIAIDDVDAGANPVRVDLYATNGTLNLLQTTGLVFQGGADGTDSMSFTGTVADINAALSGLRFLAVSDYVGPADVQIVVDDLGNTGGAPLSDSRTVLVSVTSVNDAPEGADGTVTTSEETPYVFSALDFGFADPQDSPGDVFQAVKITTLPGGGTLTHDGTPVTAGDFISVADIASGQLKYTPFANASGAAYASLGFQVQDSGGTADGGIDLDPTLRQLTIDVDAVNDAPVNAVPGSQSTPLGAPLTFSSANGNAITVSDIDENGGGLGATLTAANGTLTLATTAGLSGLSGNGSATVSFSGSPDDISNALDGLVFTPDAGFFGPASLQIVTDDLGNTGDPGPLQTMDSIAIDVTYTAPTVTTNPVGSLAYVENDPPTPVDDALSVGAGTLGALTGAAVEITGNYVNGEDLLDYSAALLPGGVSAVWNASAGTLTFTGTATLAQYEALLRSVTYENPSENPDTAARVVTFRLDDGISTVTDGRQIDLTAVNDAPVNSVPGAQALNQDTTLVFSTGGGNAISVSDIDVAANPVQITLTATHGVLTLSGIAGLTFSSGDGTADASMTFEGTLGAVNTALQGLGYTANSGYSGSASITVVTSDLGATGTGGVLDDTDAIALTILPTGSISGTVFHDVDGDADVTEPGTQRFAGAFVRIYRDSGNGMPGPEDTLSLSLLTNASGQYSVSGLMNGTYWVTVDSRSLGASGYETGYAAGDVWADQTYGVAGAMQGAGFLGMSGALYGGRDPGASDDASTLATSEHITGVTLTGTMVGGIDYGFSFNAIVNTRGDAADDDGTGTGRMQQGSLRQFLLNSNAIDGLQTANFSVGTGPITISPDAVLPAITDTVVLDATSQEGFSGAPVVELDGSGAGVGTSGFTLAAGSNGSTIRGFVVNRFDGHLVDIDGSDNNVIAGNYLGTDLNGTADFGSPNSGVLLHAGASGNRIGGTVAADRNVISGNDYAGISMHDAGTDSNIVQGNYIGTGATGAGTIGNGGFGVAIWNGAKGNQIGGVAPGAGNVIANNGSGVIVDSNTVAALENAVLGNRIFGNSGLGIDLFPSGVTGNDAGDGDSGPNGLQNYPVLSSAVTTGSQVTVTGTLNSSATTSFHIEFFASGVADPSGHGEAERYLGFADVTTDGSGNASINAVLTAAVGAGELVTATATRTDATFSTFYDTSEFAQNVAAVPANVPPVNAVPGSQVVNEDTTQAIAGVSVSDVDSNLSTVQLGVLSGVLNVSLAGGATISAGANGAGTLTLAGTQTQINTALASLTYRGNSNFAGSDTLTVLSTDAGGLNDGDAVSITVAAVNDAPGVALPSSQSTQINTALVLSTGNGNAITVSDVDAGVGLLRVTLLGTNGKSTLASLTGLSLVAGNGTANVVFQGTLTNINNALNGLIFTPNTNFFGGAQLQVAVDDQGNTGSGGPKLTNPSLFVNVIYTPPNLTATGGALAYVENAPASAVDPGLTLAPGNVNPLTGAQARVSANYVNGEDVLAYNAGTLPGGVVANWDAATGTLSFSGNATAAAYQALLTSVTYENLSENPSTAVRTVTFTAFDGVGSDAGAKQISVTAVNDAPVHSVPGPQSVPIDTALIFSTANGNAISASDADLGAGTFSVAVTVLNGRLALGDTTGLSGLSGDGTSAVVFTASATDLNNALQGLTYTPDPGYYGSTSILFRTDDQGSSGTGGPQVTQTSIVVDVVYTAPTLTASVGNVAYTENDPATPVDDNLTLTSGTFGALTGAEVRISGSFAGPEDVLDFSAAALPGGTIANWDAGTGTLSFSGTATVAEYETLLRSVTYANTSDTPSTATRTLTFKIDDGTTMTAGGRQIDMTAVNDAPTIAPISDQTLTEGGSSGILAFTIGDAETAAGALSVTAASSDTLRIPDANLVLSGSGANRTITVIPAADAYGGPVTITLSVSDGVTATLQSFDVTIDPVADYVVVVDTTDDLEDGDTSSIDALLMDRGADGFISLREAIIATNNSVNGTGPDQIHFNIAGAGPHTIDVLSELPAVTDAVIIDGTTNPDFTGAPVIELNGALAGAGVDGLSLGGGDSTVRGLVINRFDGSGIFVGSSGNVIQGNYIGLDAAGNSDFGNSQWGIWVTSDSNLIGGTAPGDRNVISGNDVDGVHIDGGSDNLVQGNYVGTNASGTGAVGNGEDGIWLHNAFNNIIGGTTPGAGNLLSGNSWSGVGLSGGGADNVIQGNYIGVDASGSAALPNQTHGIAVFGADGTLIGGTAPGAGNVIAFNQQDGVAITSGTGHSVLGNSIYNNGGLGIDINDNGVTGNDLGDLDLGTNLRMNFPVIYSVAVSGGNVTITGEGRSGATVELFKAAADASGYGEGKTFIGSGVVSGATPGAADVTARRFSYTFAAGSLAVGDRVTATATDAGGNTSEFSLNVVASGTGPGITVTPTSGLTTTEDGGTATFSVVLDTQPTADVTIALSSSDPTEGTAGPASLTFTTTNWNAAQTVTVTGVPDLLTDGNVAYSIVLGAATSTDPAYNGIDPADVALLNLDGVNDAPVNSVPGTQSTAEDTTLVFSTGSGNAIAVSDIDAGTAPVQVTLSTGQGAITLSSTAGLVFSGGDGVNDAAMTFTGTIADINVALDGLSFKPTADFAGFAALSITTDDLGGSGSGGPKSHSDTININVTPVNDAPTGNVVISGTAAEGQILTAVTGAIADVDGLGPFSYQWARSTDGGSSWTSIAGATTSTYALVGSDVGALIQVSVGYTDGQGTTESLTSASVGPVSNVNDPPTGTVAIVGSATEDQTLSADPSGIADGDGLGAFSYQWSRSTDGGGTWNSIAGANASSYTLGDADVGGLIEVMVSYIDGQGAAESVTSSAAGPVANINDVPTGAVTITGIATEDQLLVADTSTIADADGLGAFSYQWARSTDAGATWVNVGGATASAYLLGDADVGALIHVSIGYVDAHGTAESLTSTSAGPVANVNDLPTGTVTITGTATEDQILGANTGTIADADGLGGLAYQWGRSTDGGATWSNIAGAVSSTYVLGDADVGALVRVSTTYTDGHGTLESLTSAATGPVVNVNDAPGGTVVITGLATEDQTLAADTSAISDADGLGVFGYQWARSTDSGATWTNITGASAATYVLTDSDVGTLVRVGVSYTDGHGTVESLTSAGAGPVANVNDAPTGTVVVSGTVMEGQILAADASTVADADGLGAFGYQWARSTDGGATWANIASANASTYLLGSADVGTLVRVGVSYTDGHGSAESLTSAGAGPVANLNDAPTGAVIITGTATEDQTLTADTSTIADADGLGAFGYQWERSSDGGATWNPIAGATTGTHTLGDADVANLIRVTVGYTDGYGTAESLTSAAAGPVVNVNDAPTGADATASVLEDSAYVFSSVDFAFADLDAGDTLQAVHIGGLPSKGVLKLYGAPVGAGALIAEVDIAAGGLAYAPAADFAGTDSFSFRVNDGLTDSLSDYTMLVAVVAVNDAPTLVVVGGNQTVNEDSGPQTVAGFATATAGGGADEAGQVLSYTVNNDNNALFAVQPTVDATGKLTYTTAANANGVANVTVLVADNGGTVNGGADTSAAQSFSISVNAVNDAPVLAVNSGASVAWGASVTLGSSLLQVTDVDNSALQITYTLTAVPATGVLYISGAAAAPGATFTQNDVNAGALSFSHNGATAGPDGLSFSVVDGAGGSLGPATLGITVAPAPPPPPPPPVVILPPPPVVPPPGGTGGTGGSGTGSGTGTGSSGSGTGTTGGSGSGTTPDTSGTDTTTDGDASDGSTGETSAAAGALGDASTSPFAPSATAASARNADLRITLADTGRVYFSQSPSAPQGDASQLLSIQGTTLGPAILAGEAPALNLSSGPALQRLDPVSVEAVTSTLRNTEWVGELDHMRKQIDGKIEVESHLVVSSVAVTGSLSVGYVIWLLRGGLLLSSLLSSMPAWHAVDPMPVLARGGDGDDDEGLDEDPLEKLFGKARDALLGGFSSKSATPVEPTSTPPAGEHGLPQAQPEGTEVTA